MGILDRLAVRHKDWVRMARSFGLDVDDANELVQDMYVRMYNYVQNSEKLNYGDDDVNTFYVYVTMRNMYYTNLKHEQKYVHVPLENIDLIDEEYNREADSNFNRLVDSVDKEVERWNWYEKKLFELYHDSDISMRKLSNDTKISLRSIYHSLKNGKERIIESCIQDFEAWKKAERSGGQN